MIRKGFVDSDRVSGLDSWFTECVYHRLLLVADDFGFYDARPAYLRAQLFSTKLDKVREADVSRALLECERAGLIRFYEVDGKRYLEILRYGQRCEKTNPKWPVPPGFCHVPRTSRKFREVPARDGVGDEYNTEGAGRAAAVLEAQALPAPPPDGFSGWAAALCQAHPSARRNRVLDGEVLLAQDVREEALAAFLRCPQAAQQAELLRAYLDDRMQEDRYRKPFYRPAGQGRFFHGLEDVLAHAERWARESGWGRRRTKKAVGGLKSPAAMDASALSPEEVERQHREQMETWRRLKEEADG